ncbi:hypothetical protein [Pseudofrankia sp. DC12]|nr:hypothetical protein [Pseudofrankia sp. DC12]
MTWHSAARPDALPVGRLHPPVHDTSHTRHLGWLLRNWLPAC